ncbi:MAG: hypothetical protein AMXMBFR49_08980 [Chlorobiota bacterium]
MNKIDLNGVWKYLPDPDSKLDISEVAAELDAGGSAETIVPSNWELHGLKNFNGTVWYARLIELPRLDVAQSVFLKFDGVDYVCDVFVNGHYCGGNEGYFAPFTVPLDPAVLKTSVNGLAVRVNSPFEEPGTVWPLRKKTVKGVLNHHDCRPGSWDLERGQDANTGGIWNSVSLLITETAIAEGVKISYEFLPGGEVSVVVKASLFCAGLEAVKRLIKVKISSPSGEITEFSREVILTPGRCEVTLIERLPEVELWYPWDLGEQKLYDFTLLVDEDGVWNDRFGFRKVELDSDESFFINDTELFLRGTNIIPEQLLSSLSDDRISMMVTMMRDANVNIVRVHAHVTRKEFYQACDAAGILVWQDFPLQWTHDDSPSFAANAVTQIKTMVNYLYNHPSIAFWSCQNEPGEQVETLDVLLEKAVLGEDSSRVVRRASNYEEHAYDGWYWGTYQHYAGAPMGPLVTEFGAQGLPEAGSLRRFLKSTTAPYDWTEWRYHDFQPDQTFNIAGVTTGNSLEEFVENSQNYQAELLDFAINQYRRRKGRGITGVFQFMFIDCWPSLTWSVIDYYGVPKKGYHAVKKAFDPLLLSVFLRQDKYYRGSMLNFEMWVVNDRYDSYENCRIEVLLNGERVVDIPGFMIGPNSNTHFGQDFFNKIPIPADTLLGEAIFRIILSSEGKSLREEEYKVLIRELA